jgi:hypothetical protein
MQRLIPWNTYGPLAKTILAGYYKFGFETMMLDHFGSSGTSVIVVYDD